MRRTMLPVMVLAAMACQPASVVLTDEEKSVLGYKVVKVFQNRYLAMVVYQAESAVPELDSSKAKE